jgi:hypothetical protein
VDSANSQLFILTQTNIAVYEMYNWVEYINQTISANNFMFSMKMLNHILDQKDLCLRELPLTKKDILEDIKPLLSLLTVKIWP